MPDRLAEVEAVRRNSRAQHNSLHASAAPVLRALVSLLDDLPAPFLAGLPGQEYVAFLANAAAIREILEVWRHGDYHARGIALGPLPGAILSPPAAILHLLTKCPDELPTTNSDALGFISDPEFRDILIRDMASVEEALGNNEFKAATVLAGSVIEALLLWALRNDDGNKVTKAIARLVESGVIKQDLPRDLRKPPWGLGTYILLAEERRAISTTTARIAETAKTFRDLIHPAAEIRERRSPSLDTARAVAAAVGLVTSDLSSTLGARNRQSPPESH